MSGENSILKFMQDDLKVKGILGDKAFYPAFTNDVEHTTVVYQFTPVRSGIIQEAGLTLKVIGPDYDMATNAAEAIKKLMDMDYQPAFRVYGDIYFYSTLQGGGELYNPTYKVYEITINLNIIWRCIN